ncbi:hypothetical protein B0H14DRAFT_3134334 [Mycena olivaceomarginata]|nr:hypothetical protein B0H14DRAFT_3134334 [Mycena olivaceomarginata]
MSGKGKEKGGEDTVAMEGLGGTLLVPSHSRSMAGQTAATFVHTASPAPHRDAPPSTATTNAVDDDDESEEEDVSPTKTPKRKPVRKVGSAASIGGAAKKPRANTKEWFVARVEEKTTELQTLVNSLVTRIEDAEQSAADAHVEIAVLREKLKVLDEVWDLRKGRARSYSDTGSESRSDGGESRDSRQEVEGSLKRSATEVLEPEPETKRARREHSRQQSARIARAPAPALALLTVTLALLVALALLAVALALVPTAPPAASKQKEHFSPLRNVSGQHHPSPGSMRGRNNTVAGSSGHRAQGPPRGSGHRGFSNRGGPSYQRGSPPYSANQPPQYRGAAFRYGGGMHQGGGRDGGAHQYGPDSNILPPPSMSAQYRPADNILPPPSMSAPPPPPSEPRYPSGSTSVVVGPVRWQQGRTRDGLMSFVDMMARAGLSPPIPNHISEPMANDLQHVVARFSTRREGGDFSQDWNSWAQGSAYSATRAICRD